ncbi:NTP transferase domain-containing protein [Elizabethkingia anophelis]|uniref:2-C-methyl-D-erythritol 4-phosphate cytidylyltransferase n=1 Tax=Elizabethkingia anophelis TaxID=1117645 RepID=A0A7Z7LU84_9FLAO|nr:NTP transferase domain-containing protein [Elizabethkingia anophelis]STC98321.1 2-C-methyl-D-erythritol 4-phosphate cytidylyltransferase [Elizabethkingia anophelis]
MIAIILAAGSGRRLNINKPKGLLNIGNSPLIQYSINNLIKTKEISKIYIVVGYAHVKYENYFNSLDFGIEIEALYNPQFDSSGSMYSLYVAIQKIVEVNDVSNDFVILDSDIIYNYDEFTHYLANPYNNAVFATNVPPERYDACYIKANNKDLLEQISKNINIVNSLNEHTVWEHIGIIKTSAQTIYPMKEYCERIFESTSSLQHEYDDIFENLLFDYKVCKYENYIWAEVDDDIQLNHLITNVYPKLNLF